MTLSPRLLLIAALLLTAALYWPGLGGPFMLDDFETFVRLQRWMAGQDSWQSAMFGHQASLDARPVAMASLMLSAALGGGVDPFAFKLGNLLVHLLCGVLVWQVVRQATRQDAVLGERAEGIALAVAALWLLHPFNASTLLYAVQRMAQLGTLFALAAVWTYLSARTALLAGHARKAAWQLFALFPLLVIAGYFSKQHAAIAPALCLVLELAYFLGRPPATGRRTLATFFGLFLLVPAALLLAVLILQPERLLAGYADYDFTLTERLLTQPRVLMGYLAQLLVPRGALMGLYTDDVVASTGWFAPPATLYAFLGLLAISAVAVAARRRVPALFAGWFFFLAAHVIESSFLPLDLAFEHRNYLPAVGLLWALVGGVAPLLARVPTNILSPRQLGIMACCALLLSYAVATLGRALVWQDRTQIISQGLQHHPESLRAHLDAAALTQGNNKQAHDEITQRLIASEAPQWRVLGRLYRVTAACARGEPADPALLRAAASEKLPRISLTEVHAFRALAARVDPPATCAGLTPGLAASTITQLVDATDVRHATQQPTWLSRYEAAKLFGHAALWEQAEAQATLAWQPTADAGVGFYLANLQARGGRLEQAQATLGDVAARTHCNDTRGRAEIDKTWSAWQALRQGGRMSPGMAPPAWKCRAM
ncbi:MAG TPA: hypothetical protein VGE09_16110 [Pseudoxanthomonas sp.]